MQRYHGLLKVEIKRGKDLRNADLIGKSDPYAQIEFQKGTALPQKAKTNTVDNCLNPEWNESFYFLVNDVFESFKITLYDEDLGGDDSLGHVTILRKDHKKRYTSSGEFYYLEGGKGGTVEVFTQEVDLSNGIDQMLEDKKEALAASLSGPKEQLMLLQVNVQHAQGLKKADWFGKSDPYAVFNFSKDDEGSSVLPRTLRTPTVFKTLNPVWNIKYHFLVPWALKTFRFDIYDHDDGSSDDLIGKCNLLLGKDGEMKSGEYAVESKGRMAVEYIRVPFSALFNNK